MQTRIAFYFDPYSIENKQFAVEKENGVGGKKRYLRGIASGPSVDGHGERITDKCIKSFTRQANQGDLLLFADKHGVAYTDDIGILTKQDITPNGDWFVEFRLYDQTDGVGQNTIETSDKLWRQVNGLPPYKHPKQKGFSIEGFIPEGGILSMDSGGRRIIDEVQLDGCVVVPRPAYKTSVAQALYKALNETPPWVTANAIEKSLADKIKTEDGDANYYRKWYQIQEALEEQIQEVMSADSKDKKRRLVMLFDEYKSMMIDLILVSEETFRKNPEPTSQALNEVTLIYKQTDKLTVYKELLSNLDMLQKKLEGAK